MLDEAIDEVDIRFGERTGASVVSAFVDIRNEDGASGIADNDETVMLGLGGNSEDVDEEGDGTETELSDERPLGTSGRALSGARDFCGGSRFPTAAR